MRPYRTFALLLASALVAAGCGAVEDGVRDLATTAEEVVSEIGSPGSGTGQDGASGGTPGDGGDATGGEGQGGGGTGGDGGDQSGGDGSGNGGGQDGGTNATPADDLGGVGANGRAYLRGDRSQVVVEVDVQEGASVSQEAIMHLGATIRDVADKQDGINFAGGTTFSSDRREWTTADLRAAADQHRQHYTDADTAVIYILVVRGGFYRDGEQTNAIGVAYNASEMAVFPDRWSGLTAALGSSTAIARAVLVHEFGHLLGLVNLTYDSEVDHEDPEHSGHSANRESVMYYAIETTLIGQVFTGPPPDRFDADDLADIEGLRSGRY